jgi:predicted RNA-binding protein YlxR (DUF448 family)
MKHTPLRTCLITREKLPKNQLLRIVKTKDQGVIFDPSGKMNGRGAYIKNDFNVINKARQMKLLSKHFETDIDASFYETLEAMCHDA